MLKSSRDYSATFFVIKIKSRPYISMGGIIMKNKLKKAINYIDEQPYIKVLQYKYVIFHSIYLIKEVSEEMIVLHDRHKDVHIIGNHLKISYMNQMEAMITGDITGLSFQSRDNHESI